ncbi:hypothetical protein MLD38_024784 [Melastoma candidum]|uniref:Uncharacterized protein n=1 Tax=Melastoma candidum TaxID=119954 RepID=A0ACB9NTC5_9MYRT|nr:hypothetical protein MLD38_024784 [Melastoma candidum]
MTVADSNPLVIKHTAHQVIEQIRRSLPKLASAHGKIPNPFEWPKILARKKGKQPPKGKTDMSKHTWGRDGLAAKGDIGDLQSRTEREARTTDGQGRMDGRHCPVAELKGTPWEGLPEEQEDSSP